jgi:hypothetical protein
MPVARIRHVGQPHNALQFSDGYYLTGKTK